MTGEGSAARRPLAAPEAARPRLAATLPMGPPRPMVESRRPMAEGDGLLGCGQCPTCGWSSRGQGLRLVTVDGRLGFASVTHSEAHAGHAQQRIPRMLKFALGGSLNAPLHRPLSTTARHHLNLCHRTQTQVAWAAHFS